jgi:glycosyltransferase involved in cell wall biosynthesis
MRLPDQTIAMRHESLLADRDPPRFSTVGGKTRLVYLAPGDIQVARVDRQAIVYFCSALVRAGVDVELVTLGIRLADTERHRATDPLDLYGVETRFPILTAPTSLSQTSRGIHWGIERLRVDVLEAARAIRRTGPSERLILYTKNYAPALALLSLRWLGQFTILFEAHTLPRSRRERFVLERVDGIVANSYALARDLRDSTGSSRILGVHQGVDLRPYDEAGDRESARKRLDLPLDRPIVGYTGKIHTGYEEVEHIVRAASMPELADVLFVLVGGRADHVQAWRESMRDRKIENVVFTGFVPPAEVHGYQTASDVLVLYYPEGHQLNAYRSPGKLFGYMAAGAPIVAVDLPVLREVLGEPPAARMVKPDSPPALASAIKDVLDDPAGSQAMAERARGQVASFTWDTRATQVLDFARSIEARRGVNGNRIQPEARRAKGDPATSKQSDETTASGRRQLLVLALAGHPSSRLRIGQYLPALGQMGFDIDVIELPSPRPPAKALARIAAALRRADVVFVQRAASIPLNLLLQRASARIVYDVDDALHVIRPHQLEEAQRPSSLQSRLRVKYRELARGSRYYGSRKRSIDDLMRMCDVMIVGNTFLQDELASGARNAIVLPTCVQVHPGRRKIHSDTRPVKIGWIGTRNNLPQLDGLDGAFRELAHRYGEEVMLTVVCSAPYETPAIRTEFIPWHVDTETNSVLTFDIGIMPLADDLFARGKCSFKAIQCMALGIPVVVSPVGMNRQVVQDRANGFFAETNRDWVDHLSALIRDVDLRSRLGAEARRTISRSYSYERAIESLRLILDANRYRELSNCSSSSQYPAYEPTEPRSVLDHSTHSR